MVLFSWHENKLVSFYITLRNDQTPGVTMCSGGLTALFPLMLNIHPVAALHQEGPNYA